MLGIGIDTGGTCTDAVIMDTETKKILGAGKALTTKENLEIGIANALDTLPQDLVRQAESLSLSTTLATNAAVENKGCRAKLLLIGFDPSIMEHLKEIYASYGFQDMDQFIIIDAKVEKIFSEPYDPDWEDLKRRLPEYFSDCDAVGIVQKHPRANGGRFELTARKILEKELTIPVTIAYDISDEVDILKSCAGTMLNARLIPLISEFMEAVRHVMKTRGIDIPISIVRSDGSLMSEQMARECPVETLLCGPAASVVGGSTISEKEDAMIIDMGGTTTDIAIVRHGEPVMADTGIHIGQWKTMVKGLYVDTFGLGGDSAVRFKDHELFLDTTRVIPISVLAAQYDSVIPKLKALADEKRFHACWIHEFYVLQKDISDKNGYTKEEKAVCEALKNGPLITMELADMFDKDPHFLRLERLEQDGVLMKSGLTPTDMMVIKGDFDRYDKKAALLAMECMQANLRMEMADIPDAVYELVVKKMYKNIVRIMLHQEYGNQKNLFATEAQEELLELLYRQAKDASEHKEAERTQEADLGFRIHVPLVGVGAPIHIFLPKVGALLGTTTVIPEHAGVANALGAAASRIISRSIVRVKAEYKDGYCYGYSVFENGQLHMLDDCKEAEDFGCEVAKRAAREKAMRQGMKTEPQIDVSLRRIKSSPDDFGVLFETVITATATEK